MLLFDRILLILASCCLSIVLMIFFTGEIIPTHQVNSATSTFKIEQKNISSNSNSNATLPILSDKYLEDKEEISLGTTPPEEEILVYGEEIDKEIEKYFHNIRNQPEIDEEQKRVIDNLIEPDKKIFLTEPDVKTIVPNIEVADEKPIVPSIDTKQDKSGFVIHTVQNGESLWRISNRFKVPVYVIISANPDKAHKVIHPGDRLKIPLSTGIFYTVRSGDNLSLIAKRYQINVNSIKTENNLTTNTLKIGQELFLPKAKPLPQMQYIWQNQFIWPILGARRVTSGYGWRMHPLHHIKRFHTGIDIGARWGTSIRSVARGIVIHAGNAGSYGNLVLVRHRDGYISAYAHCSKLLVRSGAIVNSGQVIARVGASGNVTGSHLHFEMKRYKTSLNPLKALFVRIKTPVVQKY